MIPARLAVVRGWDLRSIGSLVAACAASWLLSTVTIHLRTAADFAIASPVLDRLVLVGLVLPVAVIVRNLEDRCAWLLATSSRRTSLIRGRYLLGVYLGSLILASGLARATPGQQSRLLIFSDFALLLGLGCLAAIVFGSQLGWTAPAALALICSTPGLIPLSINVLVRADQAWNILWASVALLALTMAVFALADDYGLGRRRLLSRLAGTTDE